MPTNPPINTRMALLGALVETTSGTANVPTVALPNSQIFDIVCEPDGLYEGGEVRPDGNHGGSAKRNKTVQKGKLTFKMRLRHLDGLYTLLRGCGFVISGDDDEIAKPSWVNFAVRETLTFRVWQGGTYKQIYGANGTCKIAPEGPGQAVIAEFEYMGLWAAPGDQAMPSDPTLTTAAFRAAGMTISVGGGSIPQIDGWELDMGQEVAPRQDITADSALHRFQVEDGSPKLTIAPEYRLVAHYDHYGLLLAGTQQAVSFVLTDGTNTLTIAAAAAQRISGGDGSREKKRTVPTELELQKDSSGDDLTLTYSVPA